MNPQDKLTITKCLPDLVQNIQLSDDFTKLLVEKRIFSQRMMDDILTNDHPIGKFFSDLLRRGPECFGNFIAALLETGQNNVLAILSRKRRELGFSEHQLNSVVFNPSRNNEMQSAPVKPRLENTMSSEYLKKVLHPPSYATDLPALATPVVMDALSLASYDQMDIIVKPSTEVKGVGKNVYLNNGRYPRGLALILNYKNFPALDCREGSERDVIKLDKLLQALGYTVIIRSELSLVETIREIDEFTRMTAHEEADSTIVAIMSHGKSGNLSEGTLIQTCDGRHIASEDILRSFNSASCPSLQGKPKIFLFQFCRGDLRDFGIRAHQARQVVADGKRSVPVNDLLEVHRSYEDMLIAYSTLPGHVSYREEDEGTWFMKAVCLVFMERACELDVHALLNEVDILIKSWTAAKDGKLSKQTTEISQRGFNRKFYFNPGLWKPVDQSN